MSRSAYNPTGAKLKGVKGTIACKRGSIAHYEESPLASTTTKIHAAITLTTEVQHISTGITNPDVPRVISITGVKAGGALTGDVVIHGTDASGAIITDTIALNDNATVNGVKAFKTVTLIDVPVYVTSGDTVSIGTTDLLGLIHLLSQNTVWEVFLNNVKETTAPTVTVSSDVLSLNTVDLNSALDGNQVDIWYFV